MELRVWVDGLDRVVSGVSTHTSCQEIIYALARATSHTGRFVLVEQWRSTERSLAPNDFPVQILQKWGEHARDVTFVLKCLDTNTAANTSTGSMPYFVSNSGPYPSSGTLPRQARQTEATTVFSTNSSTVQRQNNANAISVNSLPGRSTDSPLTINDNSGSRPNLTRPPAPPSYTESMKRRHMTHSVSSPVPFNSGYDNSSGSAASDYMSLSQQISTVSSQRENLRLNMLQMKNADRELQEAISRGQLLHMQTNAVKMSIEQVQNKIDMFQDQARELEACVSALQDNESGNTGISGEIPEKENESSSQIPGMWV